MTPTEHATRMAGYEPFFGLNERPFSLAPDPRFLFASASHSDALAQLAYAVERHEPIVVVTGEIGTGKTLLCRAVLQRLPRKTFVSVVNDPLLGPHDLLKLLLRDFGMISRESVQQSGATRHEHAEALHGFLRSLSALKAHAVVIVDEAQHLQPGVLEQIRLLSNLDDERGTLLQIVLVGQTDVENLLARPELRQFKQRVTRHLRLEPLTREEVEQYVAHRLARAREGFASRSPGAAELAKALADWQGPAPSVDFDPIAIGAIARVTGGLPRQINLICDRALEEAFSRKVRVVDGAIVQAASRAVGSDDVLSPEPALPEPALPDRALELDAAAAPTPAGVAKPETSIGEAAVADASSRAVASTAPATGVEPAPARPSPADADRPVSGEVAVASTSPAAVEDLAPAGPPPDHSDRAVSVHRFPHEQASHANEETDLAFADDVHDDSQRRTRWLAGIAAVLALATVVVWMATRTSAPMEKAERPSVSPAPVYAPPSSEKQPSAAPAVTAPAAIGPAGESSATGTAAASGSVGTGAAAPSASAAPGTSFPPGGADIVVASFKTEARAAEVEANLAALDLPVRRRVVGSWQQVICGPFTSRDSAEEAQQRLTRLGFTGMKIIVPAGQ